MAIYLRKRHTVPKCATPSASRELDFGSAKVAYVYCIITCRFFPEVSKFMSLCSSTYSFLFCTSVAWKISGPRTPHRISLTLSPSLSRSAYFFIHVLVFLPISTSWQSHADGVFSRCSPSRVKKHFGSTSWVPRHRNWKKSYPSSLLHLKNRKLIHSSIL